MAHDSKTTSNDLLGMIVDALEDGLDISGGSLTVNAITDEELRASPLEVKGAVADNAAETENPVPIAGNAVTSASYAPAYTAGDRAVIAVDKDAGEILTRANIRKLTAADDFVSAAGDVAHDSPDTGLPLKIGGKALSADPTAVTANDRVNAYFDTLGRQYIISAGNEGQTVFGNSARTASHNSSAQTTGHARGIMLIFFVQTVTGAASVTPTIEVEDPLSLGFGTLLTLPAITSTGTKVAQVYPGIVENTGAFPYAASRAIPRRWRVACAHANGDSITYGCARYVLI